MAIGKPGNHAIVSGQLNIQQNNQSDKLNVVTERYSFYSWLSEELQVETDVIPFVWTGSNQNHISQDNNKPIR